MPDANCHSCGFRISEGVYAYMAGNLVFCRRCVRGPHPYGQEPTRTPTLIRKQQGLALAGFVPTQQGDTL